MDQNPTLNISHFFLYLQKFHWWDKTYNLGIFSNGEKMWWEIQNMVLGFAQEYACSNLVRVKVLVFLQISKKKSTEGKFFFFGILINKINKNQLWDNYYSSMLYKILRV